MLKEYNLPNCLTFDSFQPETCSNDKQNVQLQNNLFIRLLAIQQSAWVKSTASFNIQQCPISHVQHSRSLLQITLSTFMAPDELIALMGVICHDIH